MKNNKNIQYFKLIGTVHLISELIHIPRNGSPDLFKKTLTIETPDGQVLFPEARNHKVRILEENNIQIKDKVEIEYSFEGSTKNNKRYNNIYLNQIKKIE